MCNKDDCEHEGEHRLYHVIGEDCPCEERCLDCDYVVSECECCHGCGYTYSNCHCCSVCFSNTDYCDCCEDCDVGDRDDCACCEHCGREEHYCRCKKGEYRPSGVRALKEWEKAHGINNKKK